jgi:hypothetical protein
LQKQFAVASDIRAGASHEASQPIPWNSMWNCGKLPKKKYVCFGEVRALQGVSLLEGDLAGFFSILNFFSFLKMFKVEFEFCLGARGAFSAARWLNHQHVPWMLRRYSHTGPFGCYLLSIHRKLWRSRQHLLHCFPSDATLKHVAAVCSSTAHQTHCVHSEPHPGAHVL